METKLFLMIVCSLAILISSPILIRGSSFSNDGSRYRDSQSNTRQSQGNLQKGQGKDCRNQRAQELQETRLRESTKQGSLWLTETDTEVAIMDSSLDFLKSFICTLLLFNIGFCRTLNSGSRGVIDMYAHF